jgi:RimJ/RimL family protein N-acetyltransferase
MSMDPLACARIETVTEELGPALAARLPDIPRWVEGRAYLLSGTCDLFGVSDLENIAAAEPALVVRDPTTGFIVVIGAPNASAIRAAIANLPPGASLVAAPEHAAHVARALPREWTQTRAILHVLPTPDRLPAAGDVRLVDASALRAQPLVPEELLRELEAAIATSPVAASIVDGRPVSFCYPSAVTETLWDISIDTLAEHRRGGHAARAVAWMIRHMLSSSGQAPVWAALEDNPASWRLAEKLGFEAVDELAFFEP